MGFSVPNNNSYISVRGFNSLENINAGESSTEREMYRLLENDKFVKIYSTSSVFSWCGNVSFDATPRIGLFSNTAFLHKDVTQLRFLIDWGDSSAFSVRFSFDFGVPGVYSLACPFYVGSFGVSDFTLTSSSFVEGVGSLKVDVTGTGVISMIQIYECLGTSIP